MSTFRIFILLCLYPSQIIRMNPICFHNQILNFTLKFETKNKVKVKLYFFIFSAQQETSSNIISDHCFKNNFTFERLAITYSLRKFYFKLDADNILIQINIIINMEQSKFPKSIAYSRLAKPNSNKQTVADQSLARKSTGHIYQELLSQFDPKQQKYLRDLVSKNSKEHADSNHFHNRRKSYADLEVQNSNKKQSKQEKPREERQTLCKTKQPKDLVLHQQVTPKNSYGIQMTRNDFNSRTSFNLESQNNKIPFDIQRESLKMSSGFFLDNLINYLQQLNQVDSHISKLNIEAEKLSQTLKISNRSTENYKYASKIEQQMLKIKQLKLKNNCIEKQIAKRDQREKKMKGCLYQMLQQIKQLNSELTMEKKQRKRLQKVIENFEMRSQQFQRKTIGKSYNLSKIQEFTNKISEFTENQQEKSVLDSSFRQMWKHSTAGNSKSKHPIYISHGGFENRRGQLDSTKIQKIFRSNYHSQDEQDDIYQ